MGFVVDIMGLSANVMTDKELYSLSGLYLGNDATNIMYMFSVDTLKKVSGNEELLAIMNEADVCLPAERTILNKQNRQMRIGMVKSYRNFFNMLKIAGLVRNVYLVGKNERIMESMTEVLLSYNPVLDICGRYSFSDEMSDESIVNDINSKAPNVLLLALDTPDVQKWIANNRHLINTKLCVCLCDISETIIKENVEPPRLIHILRLGKLYNSMIRRKYTESKKKERIFQAMLAEYNDKKEE